MQAARIISLISYCLIIFYPTMAGADFTIRYDAVHPDQTKQPLYSASIKNDLIRFNQLSGQKSSILINLSSGDIAQVHAASKKYFKTDAQTLNQYASFYRDNRTLVQGLIDQGLSQLDPQNRNKVQQILQGLKKSNSDIQQISFKKTPIVHQVLGAPCEVLSLYEKQKHIRDVCLASYQQLQLEQPDIQSLEHLKKVVHQFKPSAPRKYQDLLNALESGIQQLSGIPMKIVEYTADGKIRQVIQAGAISVRTIGIDTFIIPPDFEQQMMPVL